MSSGYEFRNRLTAILSAGVASHLIAPALILYFSCFLDVLTTELVILYGGMELNPLMAIFTSLPVLHLLIKGGVVVIIFLLASFSEQKYPGSGNLVFGIAIAWFLAVVIHNAYVLALMIRP